MPKKPLIPKKFSRKMFHGKVSNKTLIVQLLADGMSAEHLIAQGISKAEIQKAANNLVKLKKVISLMKK